MSALAVSIADKSSRIMFSISAASVAWSFMVTTMHRHLWKSCSFGSIVSCSPAMISKMMAYTSNQQRLQNPFCKIESESSIKHFHQSDVLVDVGWCRKDSMATFLRCCCVFSLCWRLIGRCLWDKCFDPRPSRLLSVMIYFLLFLLIKKSNSCAHWM